MKRLAATLLLAVTVGAPRGAAAKPSTVRVSPQPCAARIVDVPRLLAVLRIELTSSLGRPVAIVRADPADHRVTIDCDADSLLLDLARRQPAATWRGRILLDDVPRKLRPRTLALAIAEQFLALDLPPRAALPSPPPPAAPAATPPPPPPPPVSPSPPSPTVAAPPPAPIDVVATVPAPAPAPRRDTVRLTRNLAIGLSVASLAPLIIGGSLLAIGERDPSQPIQGLVVPGAILLGLGGAMLSGAGISFGLWLYERDQASTLTLAPLPGGLGVAWSGQF